MNLLLRYAHGKGPFIEDSKGNQRVLALIKDTHSYYLCFYDELTKGIYVEEVINKYENSFKSSNLQVIKDENLHYELSEFLVEKEILKKF